MYYLLDVAGLSLFSIRYCWALQVVYPSVIYWMLLVFPYFPSVIVGRYRSFIHPLFYWMLRVFPYFPSVIVGRYRSFIHPLLLDGAGLYWILTD